MTAIYKDEVLDQTLRRDINCWCLSPASLKNMMCADKFRLHMTWTVFDICTPYRSCHILASNTNLPVSLSNIHELFASLSIHAEDYTAFLLKWELNIHSFCSTTQPWASAPHLSNQSKRCSLRRTPWWWAWCSAPTEAPPALGRRRCSWSPPCPGCRGGCVPCAAPPSVLYSGLPPPPESQGHAELTSSLASQGKGEG